jgi:hypothetical protein
MNAALVNIYLKTTDLKSIYGYNCLGGFEWTALANRNKVHVAKFK